MLLNTTIYHTHKKTHKNKKKQQKKTKKTKKTKKQKSFFLIVSLLHYFYLKVIFKCFSLNITLMFFINISFLFFTQHF